MPLVTITLPSRLIYKEMTFKDLEIIEPILRALQAQGYTHPTPIQQQSIPILLKGKDLLGCAQTGTGKTAAFAIPILQRMYQTRGPKKGKPKIRALVVAPTRELAIQIDESFKAYGKHTGLRNTAIFGGVKQRAQTDILRRGVDILVATPGRLLDLIQQGFISLRDVEYSVLDEADRMLDMGFIHDIKKIIALLPHKRQSLFFSATMAPEIVTLSRKLLGNPEKVTIQPDQTTAERVEQAVYLVSKPDKKKLLMHIMKTSDATSVLVFSRTKHGADKIVRILRKNNVESEAIHGNKSQGARQRALKNFKDGRTRALVATDIAARGIDVDQLELVINYDLPNISETYVHRIGRTGRAQASGIAISFCDVEERAYLRDIEKLISQKIPVITDHPYVDETDEKTWVKPKKVQQQKRRRPQSGQGRSNNGRWKKRTSSASGRSRNKK